VKIDRADDVPENVAKKRWGDAKGILSKVGFMGDYAHMMHAVSLPPLEGDGVRAAGAFAGGRPKNASMHYELLTSHLTQEDKRQFNVSHALWHHAVRG